MESKRNMFKYNWIPKLTIKLNISTSFPLLQGIKSVFLNKFKFVAAAKKLYFKYAHCAQPCTHEHFSYNVTLQLSVQYNYTYIFKKEVIVKLLKNISIFLV